MASWFTVGKGDVVDTNRGKALIEDGVALGNRWLLVEFVEGEWEGKRVWLVPDSDATSTYCDHAMEQGEWFNDAGAHGDASHGGERFPDLSGCLVEIERRYLVSYKLRDGEREIFLTDAGQPVVVAQSDLDEFVARLKSKPMHDAAWSTRSDRADTLEDEWEGVRVFVVQIGKSEER